MKPPSLFLICCSSLQNKLHQLPEGAQTNSHQRATLLLRPMRLSMQSHLQPQEARGSSALGTVGTRCSTRVSREGAALSDQGLGDPQLSPWEQTVISDLLVFQQKALGETSVSDWVITG